MVRKFISCLVLITFVCSIFTQYTFAQTLNLPNPTRLLATSQEYSFPVLRGLRLNPKNPLNIEFIIDPGTQKTVNNEEAGLLVKYFLAALTIPKENLWVNLSPYEQNRIIPQALSQTELGEDMLGQDYLLKQLASSLTYPESKSGQAYWNDLKDNKAFNRVWISADQAQVYEGKNVVLITKASLKVQTEDDYLAANKNGVGVDPRVDPKQDNGRTHGSAATDAFRQHVLPSINTEINQGKNFAQLRQIYNAVVLGLWFKNKFKESFYKNYFNRETTQGIDTADPQAKEKIYNLYVEAFKNGVYNYVKKDQTQNRFGAIKINRRQYFCGGVTPADGIPETGPVTTKEAPFAGTPVVIAPAALTLGTDTAQAKRTKTLTDAQAAIDRAHMTVAGHAERLAEIGAMPGEESVVDSAQSDKELDHVKKLKEAWAKKYGKDLTGQQLEDILLVHKTLSKGWSPVTPAELESATIDASGKKIVTRDGKKFRVYTIYTGQQVITNCSKKDIDSMFNYLLVTKRFNVDQVRWLMGNGFLGKGLLKTVLAGALALAAANGCTKAEELSIESAQSGSTNNDPKYLRNPAVLANARRFICGSPTYFEEKSGETLEHAKRVIEANGIEDFIKLVYTEHLGHFYSGAPFYGFKYSTYNNFKGLGSPMLGAYADLMSSVYSSHKNEIIKSYGAAAIPAMRLYLEVSSGYEDTARPDRQISVALDVLAEIGDEDSLESIYRFASDPNHEHLAVEKANDIFDKICTRHDLSPTGQRALRKVKKLQTPAEIIAAILAATYVGAWTVKRVVDSGDKKDAYLKELKAQWLKKFGTSLAEPQLKTIWHIHSKMSKGWRPLSKLESLKYNEGAKIPVGNGRFKTVYKAYTGELAVTNCSDRLIEKMFGALSRSRQFTPEQSRWLMDLGFLGSSLAETIVAAAVAVAVAGGSTPVEADDSPVDNTNITIPVTSAPVEKNSAIDNMRSSDYAALKTAIEAISPQWPDADKVKAFENIFHNSAIVETRLNGDPSEWWNQRANAELIKIITGKLAENKNSPQVASFINGLFSITYGHLKLTAFTLLARNYWHWASLTNKDVQSWGTESVANWENIANGCVKKGLAIRVSPTEIRFVTDWRPHKEYIFGLCGDDDPTAVPRLDKALQDADENKNPVLFAHDIVLSGKYSRKDTYFQEEVSGTLQVAREILDANDFEAFVRDTITKRKGKFYNYAYGGFYDVTALTKMDNLPLRVYSEVMLNRPDAVAQYGSDAIPTLLLFLQTADPAESYDSPLGTRGPGAFYAEKSAIKALGKIGDESALPALYAIANSDNIEGYTAKFADNAFDAICKRHDLSPTGQRALLKAKKLLTPAEVIVGLTAVGYGIKRLGQRSIDASDEKERYLKALKTQWLKKFGTSLAEPQLKTIWHIHSKMSKGWRPLSKLESLKYNEGAKIPVGNGRFKTVYKVYTGELAVTNCSDKLITKMFAALAETKMFTSEQSRWLMDLGFLGEASQDKVGGLALKAINISKTGDSQNFYFEDIPAVGEIKSLGFSVNGLYKTTIGQVLGTTK